MASQDPDPGTLTVEGLDDRVVNGLRARAAHNRRSLEAEVRVILTDALAPRASADAPNLAEAIRRRFAAVGGVDLAPHPAVAVRTPVGDGGAGPVVASPRER